MLQEQTFEIVLIYGTQQPIETGEDPAKVVDMAIALNPNKSLRDCQVNRYTCIQFLTLKVSVQLMHNGNVVSSADIAIPEMMVEPDEFLHLVKEQLNIITVIEGCYNALDQKRIEMDDCIYAGQQVLIITQIDQDMEW